MSARPRTPVIPLAPAEAARVALSRIDGLNVCSIDEARPLLGLGRVGAYRLARERGELCEGVPVLKCGHLYKVPVRLLCRAIGIDVPNQVAEDQS